MTSTITDKDLQQLKDLIITGNADTQKQIAELTLNTQQQISDLAMNTQKQISDLAQEMRLGFANTDVKFAELSGKIDVLDERTKIGFWGFIGRAVIITILGLVAGLIVRYVLFGKISV